MLNDLARINHIEARAIQLGHVVEQRMKNVLAKQATTGGGVRRRVATKRARVDHRPPCVRRETETASDVNERLVAGCGKARHRPEHLPQACGAFHVLAQKNINVALLNVIEGQNVLQR